MTVNHPECANLKDQVNALLKLLQQEPKLRSQYNTIAVEHSLNKAISPRFEIVFAGAFSAGKSMLINALLERELLYSAEGHATGTECYIEYAEPNQERVVLTFLSLGEIHEQFGMMCKNLGLSTSIDPENIDRPEVIDKLQEICQEIIKKEGGESKSEYAKQAKALSLLIEGYQHNRDRINSVHNAIYSMDQLGFSNLSKAADYARRGSNSAVLKRLEYYCHHPLLKDGNILVDLPGIDAPVKKDAQLTYQKVENPDTSAVVTVLKPAAAGDMTTEETELLEKMKSNPGIRDRVFYVFNRIDQTWYNAQLRQRLDQLIQTQFRDTNRIYKTSGLLGFYGSQIKQTSGRDRFGLDSIFTESVKGLGGQEETPQFVSEFNNYCANSGKLSRSEFRVSVNGYETPNENYVRILSEWGTPLMDQLIQDSGIETFREAITQYLTNEKRPQLFTTLADDLQPICIGLKDYYNSQRQNLASQPREIDAMKAQELDRLNQQLQTIGSELEQYLAKKINLIIAEEDPDFENDFNRLKKQMVVRLDELLHQFSVLEAYKKATGSHSRNATAPFLAVLVEALYYLANELEDVLVEYAHMVVTNFCQRLLDSVKKTDSYLNLYRLLGKDGGIEQQFKKLEETLLSLIANEARRECDRYVRESPRFYDEGTFSIYQFRQTLQQTSQSYGAESIIKAEPAIRQLLKLDFEPKVSATIRSHFRQGMNQTLKTQVLPLAEQYKLDILQKYDVARAYLEKSLEKEAELKIAQNQKNLDVVEEKIAAYNQAVQGINACLQSMNLYGQQLPVISDNVSGDEFADAGELRENTDTISADLIG
ncbi:dynamin-like GTPase family protein [Planktothricoides raciborskii]|uniref:Dynamin-like GTPase family protein n=1 Tax=Planktothricoides raciborskii FACHB-1370 TaxID=2949576 RepID=A0ABR8EC67_9CYAN|nr:dynamin-like GTPase family protein [Planktothricoides raciborskii]MBD2543212.1 dynamin-like GTPase family protein [Planktothricoides raciborskii FACHB-1370]MBD2580872.1 dynamin-like GTPase family protein [Planktothricoides raciborskii FACHB-1261]